MFIYAIIVKDTKVEDTMKSAFELNSPACGDCCAARAGNGTSIKRPLQTRTDILILAAAAVLFVAALALRHYPVVSFALFFTSWLTAGNKVISQSFVNISKGRIFDENLQQDNPVKPLP